MFRRFGPAWLLAAGCAASVDATRSTGPEIAAVEIAGAPEGLDTGELTGALANHAPSGLIFRTRAQLDELALEVDRRRVESYLREQGYFAAVVEDAAILPGPEGRVRVRFTVVPGAPSVLRVLAFEGVPDTVSEETLRALLKLREGDPFRYPLYAQGKDRLREHLFASGYAHVAVTGRVQIARSTAEAAVTYSIDAGPKVVFGALRVTGDSEVPERSILARAAFSPGEPFDPERLSITERRTYELSSVGTVRFDLDDGARSSTAGIAVHVSDALPNELRLGAGVGLTASRYQITGRAAYLRRRLFHPLVSFRGELLPSLSYVKTREQAEPNIEANAELQRDDLFIPRLAAGIGARFELSQLELYSTLGPSAYVYFERPLLEDALRASARFELTNQDLKTEVPASARGAIGFYDTLRVLTFRPALTWDGRDDVLGPRRGAYLRLELELGSTLVEGGGTFLKVTPDARVYVPLGTDRLVAAARVRGGVAFAGEAVPVSHRYFSGGAESQRGFDRRLLAPDIVDADGDRGPTGGEVMFESSVELRFDAVPLWDSWLGFVFFADASDVTADAASFDFGRLHWAIGPGIRYKTPIGPLRFDFGFRLNRTGPGEPAPGEDWNFHFSLGEAF